MALKNLVEGGVYSPSLIANALRTHEHEIAQTLGLKQKALMQVKLIESKQVQTKLGGMLEILSCVESRTGSLLMAYAWFRDVPIPGFGGKTADSIVREGKINAVRAYLDEMDDGGFA